jgi:phospholipid/cholesterol/gamma-HCH transport system permease protein
MPVPTEPARASAATRTEGGRLEVDLGGEWRIGDHRPVWAEVLGAQKPERVKITAAGLGPWDTSILLFVLEARASCRKSGIDCDIESLPEKMRLLLSQFEATLKPGAKREHGEDLLTTVGLATAHATTNLGGILNFLGECVLGAARFPVRAHKFRWGDCLEQMQECGAMSLPIVSMISFLVGLTIAYEAAVELRQFGADIFVADVVGLSVVREMGPMMAAIILAGRTGAAFAATIGNMKANEEIDALEVLGLSPIDFLVLPRLLALGLMMPLLALYSNCVGILGGMVVAGMVLHIPASAYWVETQSAIDLSDLNSGLIKAATFGLLIGLSGCLRGLQAERSAAGVGRATTSAVVTAILLIVMADAIYEVLFHALGI